MNYEKAYLSLCKLIVEVSPQNLISVKNMCESIVKQMEEEKTSAIAKKTGKVNII